MKKLLMTVATVASIAAYVDVASGKTFDAQTTTVTGNQMTATANGGQDTMSCDTGHLVSDTICIMIVVVGSAAYWLATEAYPDFEREALRPVRDNLVDASERVAKDLKRSARDGAREVERGVESTIKEVERAAKRGEREVRRMRDRIRRIL